MRCLGHDGEKVIGKQALLPVLSYGVLDVGALPLARPSQHLSSCRRVRWHGPSAARFVPMLGKILAVSEWRLFVCGSFMSQEPFHMYAHGSRFVLMGDNLSSLLSFEWGRAKDFSLMSRVAVARQIGCELVQIHRYSESSRNPMDRDGCAVESGELRVGQVQQGRGVSWKPPIYIQDGRPCVLRLELLVPDVSRSTHVAPAQPRTPIRRGHGWCCLELSAGSARLGGACYEPGRSTLWMTGEVLGRRIQRVIMRWVRASRLVCSHGHAMHLAVASHPMGITEASRARGKTYSPVHHASCASSPGGGCALEHREHGILSDVYEMLNKDEKVEEDPLTTSDAWLDFNMLQQKIQGSRLSNAMKQAMDVAVPGSSGDAPRRRKGVIADNTSAGQDSAERATQQRGTRRTRSGYAHGKQREEHIRQQTRRSRSRAAPFSAAPSRGQTADR